VTHPTNRFQRGRRLAVVAFALLGLGACSSWFGDDGPPPLPGTRIAVLQSLRGIDVSPDIADLPVRLPRPVRNSEWSQPGGVPEHAQHHLSLPETLTEVWRANVGAGTTDGRFLINPPVVQGGRIFVLDTAGNVAAIDQQTGRRLWRTDTTPSEESDAVVAGGIAAGAGRVYVASGYAQVMALDAETGAVAWRQPLPAPARAAPTFSGDRVFVVTIENQLFAYAGNDGRRLWLHAGVGETAGLLGGASPAIEGTTVVAAFTSGELFALRVDNGRVVWSDSLAAVRRLDAVSALSDIRARPVIDRGTVYAVSHGGRFAAIAMRGGRRVWDMDLASVEMPWVAGDFIFILTTQNELVCLRRDDRKVRWVLQLPRFQDPAKSRGALTWAGPVLAGDRLILVGSDGRALAVSPYSGDLLGALRLPGPARLAPIVVDETLFVLTDDATLIAYR
jgi:outer membrane protein assembly factor BamB